MPWHITPIKHLVHWSEKTYIVKELGWVRAVISYGQHRRSHKGGARLILINDGTIKIDLISDTCRLSPGNYHTTRGAYRPYAIKHHKDWEAHVSGVQTITCPVAGRCDGPRDIDLDKENAWMLTLIKTHFGLRP